MSHTKLCHSKEIWVDTRQSEGVSRAQVNVAPGEWMHINHSNSDIRLGRITSDTGIHKT